MDLSDKTTIPSLKAQMGEQPAVIYYIKDSFNIK